MSDKKTARTTVAAASVNLAKNLIGAGIFSLPTALQRGSTLPGVLIIAICGGLCGSSFVLIAYLCQKMRCETYRDIGARALGPGMAVFIDASIVVNGFFACVSYVILVADFLQKALEGLFDWQGVARPPLIAVVTVFFMLPLSHVRNLSPLRYTSMLGLCIIGLVWLYVIGDCLGNISMALENLQENTFRLDMGIFSTIAISTGAFKAHYNAPRFFQELGSDLHSHVQTVILAYSAAFLLYASFALAGFGLFGSEVLGNVLRNYPSEGNRAILLAWLGMAFAIVFTYPLVFTSARDSLVLMSPGLKKALVAHPTAAHIAITTAGVSSISLVACGVEDVSLVTGLLGATVGSALCWIIPACVYIKVAMRSTASLKDKQVHLLGIAERPPILVPSRGMLVYSMLLIVLGTLSACAGVLGSLGII